MLEIATGTAAVAVFDLQCLRHRLDDVGDWFAIPEEELKELNAGNLLILELGEDGVYLFNWVDDEIENGVTANLTVQSGRVYIGAAEDVSGGGLEPSEAWGGKFLDLENGSYVFSFRRSRDGRSLIEWNFQPSAVFGNSFTRPLELR